MATLTTKKSKEDLIKKAFVPDTNVILHDHQCIQMFHEHDVIIFTTVLEELDKFKKGSEEKNFHARKFIGEMDKYRLCRTNKIGDKNNNFKTTDVSALHNGGAPIGPAKGTIHVKVSGKISKQIMSAFPGSSADNQILSTVLEMQKDPKEKRKIILVTKDVNLRVKADALGIEVEDYENDKVSDSDMYTGRSIIDNCPADLITTLYVKGSNFIDATELQKIHKSDWVDNMYFILKNGKQSVLTRFDAQSRTLIRVDKQSNICGITPKNAEQIFAVDAMMNPKKELVTTNGSAGTGKTLLAMATGLQQLKDQVYERMIIASATVPLSNKEVGFLPGDIKDKVSPYMQGIFDNLDFIKNEVSKSNAKWVDNMMDEQKKGNIQIQPLAAIRGRSINNTYFVIDEAQNLTPHEVKAIVTRAGKNTKIIFLGDVTQIDSPYLDMYSNGLAYLIVKMKNQSLYAHITLEKGERSELADLASRLL